MKTILVTGGLGYIGSHVAVELYKAGYQCVFFDNLHNSNNSTFFKIHRVAGIVPELYVNTGLKLDDIRNTESLNEVFTRYDISAVIHLAGLKAVGESVVNPLEYYDNNLNGTINLLKVMKRFGCNNLIFSSSATVYGNPTYVPIDESHPVGGTTNPYGTSKHMIEQMLEDIVTADESLSVATLRYFNPVGAHESGLLGENPKGVPNNLMPFISQVAKGRREFLSIFGDDYDTPDGTAIRDYLHVVDLAEAHVKALNYIFQHNKSVTCNLGSGKGHSVLEVVKSYEKACSKEIPYKISSRRPGDIASCYADATLAEGLLGWKATRTLDQMCKDEWNYQQKGEE